MTIGDMAEVLGVSRVTYYGWVKGHPIRTTNLGRVKTQLRKLLSIKVQNGWPSSEDMQLGVKERRERLFLLLNQQ